MNITPKADSIRAAAAMLGVPVSKLTRAKKLGCPAFKSGRVDLAILKDWLQDRAQKKPITAKSITTTLPTTALHVGAAAALKRLEQSEADLFGELQKALAVGDPEEISVARASWLRVGDSLRRHDLALEQNRREAGELIQRSDVEYHLNQLGWRLKVMPDALYYSCTSLVGLSDPNQAIAILTACQRRFLADTIASLKITAKPLPDWMQKALLAGMTDRMPADDEQLNHAIKLFRLVADQTCKLTAEQGRAWLDEQRRQFIAETKGPKDQ